MRVNLFDSNFEGSPCSTAYQVSRHIEYTYRQMSFDGVTLFTDEWINNPVVDDVRSGYKIGWLHEPYCLHPETYERALENWQKFDFILTYYQPFLDDRPWPYSNIPTNHFRFCPYAGTWIDPLDWGIKPKTKLCSMLIGEKMTTDGHRIRHDIAEMIEANGFEVDFYGARGQPVDYSQETKYTVLNDYYFGVAIETCREENEFSEWIVDCFALGTIPIFWGAPNIHQFFDAKGVLQFDTVDRVQKILGSLSPKLWLDKLPAIYDNLTKVEEYATTEDWIYENVLKGRYE